MVMISSDARVHWRH